MVCRNLPYYELRPGIFEVDEFDCVSCFVVVGEKSALLLDVGTGIGDLRWVVENRITDKPYQVVASHNHGDHVGGAGFFDEIWIHPADQNLDSPPIAPTVEFRKNYAEIIRKREGKYYAYDPETDIRPWPKEPVWKPSGGRAGVRFGRAQGDRAALPRTHGRGDGLFGMTRPTPSCAVTPATAIGCSTRLWRRRCGSVPRYR